VKERPACYQEHVGVFSIELVELIAGDLPRTQRRLGGGLGGTPPGRAQGGLGAAAGRSSPPSPSRRYNSVVSSHPLHRVTSFERVGVYVLRVEFADGSSHRSGRRITCSAASHGWRLVVASDCTPAARQMLHLKNLA
jgi:hypothetical protein